MSTINSDYVRRLPTFAQQLAAGTPRKVAVAKSHDILAVFGKRRGTDGWVAVRKTGKLLEVVTMDAGVTKLQSKHVKADCAIKAAHRLSGRTTFEFSQGVGM